MAIRISGGKISRILHIDSTSDDSHFISPVTSAGTPSKVIFICRNVRYIVEGQIFNAVIIEITGLRPYCDFPSILECDIVNNHISITSEEVLEVEEIVVSSPRLARSIPVTCGS